MSSENVDLVEVLRAVRRSSGDLRKTLLALYGLVVTVPLALLVIALSFFLVRGLVWFLEALSKRRAAQRLFFKKLIPIGRLTVWGLTIYIVLADIFELDQRGILAAATALGVAIGFGTQILPSFLMAVGVCDSVHILAIFYLARRSGTHKTDAIAYALGHSSLPILMTSLTTAGGLASFVSAELAPVQQLGIFAPIGVMFAFAYTVFLMPALMAIAPMGSPGARRASERRSWRRRSAPRPPRPNTATTSRPPAKSCGGCCPKQARTSKAICGLTPSCWRPAATKAGPMSSTSSCESSMASCG